MGRKEDQLVQTAIWYYEDGLDQSEIATRLNKSRSMVSRLLQEARAKGVIEIRVNVPVGRNTRLEAATLSRTSLSEAWILDDTDIERGELDNRLIGRLASAALQPMVRDGVSIGIAWSRTLHSVIQEFPTTALVDARVVQLSGSIALGDPRYDGPELVRVMANKTNAEYRYLVAPLIVKSRDLRDSLIAEHSIAETLEMARSVDVALIGVGSLRSSLSTMGQSGILDEKTLAHLIEAGVAGDLVGRQFLEDGAELDDDFNGRVIGLELPELKKIPHVVSVAFGVDKALAIAGALRGEWVDVLVSDTPTMEAVLGILGEDA